VTIGPSKAVIDVAVVRKLGIIVSGTGYQSHPTAKRT
jgi:hypothetical protein